jgi:hypothetical protein
MFWTLQLRLYLAGKLYYRHWPNPFFSCLGPEFTLGSAESTVSCRIHLKYLCTNVPLSVRSIHFSPSLSSQGSLSSVLIDSRDRPGC